MTSEIMFKEHPQVLNCEYLPNMLLSLLLLRDQKLQLLFEKLHFGSTKLEPLQL